MFWSSLAQCSVWTNLHSHRSQLFWQQMASNTSWISFAVRTLLNFEAPLRWSWFRLGLKVANVNPLQRFCSGNSVLCFMALWKSVQFVVFRRIHKHLRHGSNLWGLLKVAQFEPLSQSICSLVHVLALILNPRVFLSNLGNKWKTFEHNPFYCRFAACCHNYFRQ